MKRLLLIVALSLVSLSLSAAPNRKLLVSTSWLDARLSRVTVVHVAATSAEYDAGHVPGARLLLWSEFVETEGAIPNELPSNDKLVRTFEQLGIGNRGKVVLYGEDLLKSARAFVTLDALGHGDRIALLDGGLAKWRSEGRAVSIVRVVPKHASFRVRPRPQAIVRTAPLRALLGNVETTRKVALVDARPPDDYNAGRIGDATNIYWKWNLTDDATPVFRTPEELARIYRDANITQDRTAIAYCRSGVQASVTFFVLRYLGYVDVGLYDGSFVEWSQM